MSWARLQRHYPNYREFIEERACAKGWNPKRKSMMLAQPAIDLMIWWCLVAIDWPIGVLSCHNYINLHIFVQSKNEPNQDHAFTPQRSVDHWCLNDRRFMVRGKHQVYMNCNLCAKKAVHIGTQLFTKTDAFYTFNFGDGPAWKICQGRSSILCSVFTPTTKSREVSRPVKERT